MKIEPHTIQSRLKFWGQWRNEPRRYFGRSSSPFARIAEMKENAGIRPEGMAYELISDEDGVFLCKPDGGLSSEVERSGRALAHDMKCREVQQAVLSLPKAMRRTVIAMYVVPKREDVKTAQAVAERLGVSRETVREAMKVAHRKISIAVYGPFEMVFEVCEAVA